MQEKPERSEFPSLPSGYAIVFSCRDCGYQWRLELEFPALVKAFYERNRRCYLCNNANIVMDILPTSPEQRT